MRVLVTGSGGMLGGAVLAEARARGHEAAGADLPELDLSSDGAVRDVIQAHAPDAVIHCAAWTDVDAAETDEPRAFRINADGTARIVAAAPYVLAMSSDYVFPGDAGRGRPYVESDTPDPATAYGRSKVAAERAVLASGTNAILRAQWLYGAGGKNFVDTILGLAAERDEVRVVADQVGSPTWTGHVAPALLELAERRASGIFHAAGGGEATWHDLACEAVAQAGLPARVVPVTSEEFGRVAPRPAYAVLGSERDDAVAMPRWREGVTAHLRDTGRL